MMTLISITLLLLFFPHRTHAARSARRRPTGRRNDGNARYDRSVTTFSDDGRLLQVEYGVEASKRGKTAACLKWGNAVCVAAAMHDSNTTTSTTIATRKVHRLDSHCLLVTTGLVGDGRALAGAARVACQRLRLCNGETPTVQEIAEAVAETQHSLTTTAGARPFGVTAAVVGVDGDGGVKLFKSDPGGVLQEYVACAAGRCGRKAEQALVGVLEGLHDTANRTSTLSDAVGGVANVVFTADEDSVRLDLWVIESVSEGDSNAPYTTRIRCAKSVARDNLEKVKEIFGTVDI